ncbi:MAG TPA: hydrogenase iron-sulfur subunit [Longimicrobiales bacterium]
MWEIAAHRFEKAETMSLFRLLRTTLAHLDALINRLYSSRYNPIYQSGSIIVASVGILIVTGVYLLIFYRIGAPYQSVERISNQLLLGRWIRGVHRYASDVAVIATVVHALRMFLQRRSWGARTLAWTSGLTLLLFILICGWTGYVMVWDVQAQVMATAGAKLLDVLPLFSEPISRTFVGERDMPGAFFFLNLFAHIALPIGLSLLLYVHVSRVARPVLFPSRPLLYGFAGALIVGSFLLPAPLAGAADLLRVPARAPYDFIYSFWIPLAEHTSAGTAWLAALSIGCAGLLIPFMTRPRKALRPPPSVVDERVCTGCEQCYHDCPYEAIAMHEREDGRPTLVARVDPELCVSCGICAGSCAPMGVGPAGRTGRDQLTAVKTFVATRRLAARDVVVIACDRGAGAIAGSPEFMGCAVYPVQCAGSLHTSVVERLLREGAGGVMIVSCPPRDCWNREGAVWLEQRLFHEREAELQARVDRRRVRLVEAGTAERARLAQELTAFQQEIAALDDPDGDGDLDVLELCKRASEEVA